MAIIIHSKKEENIFCDERFLTPNENHEQEFTFGTERFITTAPYVYVAILSGNIDLVKYFVTAGLNLKTLSVHEAFVSSYMDQYQANSDMTSLATWGYKIRFLKSKDDTLKNKQPLLFSDPFTAAILSRNPEMIAYVANAVGDIAWSNSLEQVIAAIDNRETIEYLLTSWPEILDFMSLSTIVTYRSALLLDPFLEHHAGNMQEKWDELEQSLKDSCSKNFDFYYSRSNGHPKPFPGDSKSFQTAQQIVSFFTLLLSKGPNEQVRLAILNYILSICLCDKQLIQDEAAVFVLLRFVFENRNGLEEIEDYSRALDCMLHESDSDRETVRQIMNAIIAKEKYKPLPYTAFDEEIRRFLQQEPF